MISRPSLLTLLSLLAFTTACFGQNDSIGNYKEELTGWTDEAFVLAGDTLEYVIHFQNVIGSTVDTVVIEDGLLAPLLASTVSDVTGSHDLTFDVDTDGVLRVVFADIMLPDSSVSQTDSQGFMAFKVASSPLLAAGTLVENRARILMDSLQVIETNIVANTIFDCDGLALFDAGGIWCDGDSIELASVNEYIIDHSWSIDGVFASLDSSFTFAASPGPHFVEHSASNPLCEVLDTATVLVQDNPQPMLMLDGDSLFATETSMQLVGYFWLLNGDTLAHNGTALDVSEQGGNYTVVAVSLFTGCAGESSEIVVPSALQEYGIEGLTVGPNPVMDYLSIQINDPHLLGQELTLLTIDGRLVRHITVDQQLIKLDMSDEQAGTYLLIRAASQNRPAFYQSLIKH